MADLIHTTIEVNPAVSPSELGRLVYGETADLFEELFLPRHILTSEVEVYNGLLEQALDQSSLYIEALGQTEQTYAPTYTQAIIERFHNRPAVQEELERYTTMLAVAGLTDGQIIVLRSHAEGVLARTWGYLSTHDVAISSWDPKKREILRHVLLEEVMQGVGGYVNLRLARAQDSVESGYKMMAPFGDIQRDQTQVNILKLQKAKLAMLESHLDMINYHETVYPQLQAEQFMLDKIAQFMWCSPTLEGVMRELERFSFPVEDISDLAHITNYLHALRMDIDFGAMDDFILSEYFNSQSKLYRWVREHEDALYKLGPQGRIFSRLRRLDRYYLAA